MTYLSAGCYISLNPPYRTSGIPARVVYDEDAFRPLAVSECVSQAPVPRHEYGATVGMRSDNASFVISGSGSYHTESQSGGQNGDRVAVSLITVADYQQLWFSAMGSGPDEEAET